MISYQKDQVFQQVDENTERCVVTHSEEIMVVRVRFRKVAEETTLHSHPEEQVTYIVKGKFKFFEGNQEYLVGPGDFLRFESEVRHGCIPLEAGSELIDTFTPIRKDFL
ncbi:cupin domain-containing protein [Enterococcus sp. AZ072]|uniref:cupin domain-containing protein n=1 Tax=unclassified Enterococcus TaxID=2608891 RepID=UPI003D296568